MQSSTQPNKLTQGSLAWAAYPLTDKVDKLKRRPVLIISNESSNELDSDYIVIPITKTIRGESFSLVIQPEDVEGDLPVSSELRCNKPFTIRGLLVYEHIGQLSKSKLNEAIQFVNDSIRIQEYREI
ncbi:MAG: type II toxin-antitoxin system PemK/MazF family toxin [Cytophagaceae bacterium]|nr:MAG: type II toxin-antitoxin system PemK/MazF family toxin [Cytophagaceae bacterium]